MFVNGIFIQWINHIGNERKFCNGGDRIGVSECDSVNIVASPWQRVRIY